MIKVLIYIDDILITGTHNVVFEEFISKFSTMFVLKDLGILSYFLGIEVLYADWKFYLSQKKYIKDLLAKEKTLNCKGIETLISTRLKL